MDKTPLTTAKPATTPIARIDDLRRRYMLDITASGHVFVRGPGEARDSGALPVFSTDTREQAEDIRERFCRRARDRSGLYRMNEWSGEEEELTRAADLFRAHYAEIATQ